MEDFSYSVKNARIDFNDLFHETFTKVSEVLTAQKKLGSWFCLNLCSLRKIKGEGKAVQKFTSIYLRLPVFGKCLKWVFQVCFRRFSVGRDSLEVKKDYHRQILVNSSCHGWTFLWVGECVLGKTPKGCFSWHLEYGYG